ncbi:MAG: flagellar basal-body rod protein FlgF [Vampirovibrionales bacterium]|nr:flagellar basal-body rod protein FlgF [Vampirovibrionales bacterium]
MIRGLYSAASGITANLMESDIVANNLANVNTTGFKKVGVNYNAFGEMMMQRMGPGGTQNIGNVNNGVALAGSKIHFGQGLLKPTGNPLDVAIQGDGFFSVQDAEGNAFYTRNGSFTRSADGTLSTLDGHTVMDANDAPILIPADARDITIGSNGAVMTNGQQLGQLKLSNIDNPDTLVAQGTCLFKGSADTKVSTETPANSSLVQGYLEGSNVNVVEELIRNIMGSRRYETMQKSINSQDASLQLAVSQVGRYK